MERRGRRKATTMCVGLVIKQAKLDIFIFAHLNIVFAYLLLVPERLELPDVDEGGAEMPQGRVD